MITIFIRPSCFPKYLSYLLAIPTLTALTPQEHEIRVFDENIEDIDFNWSADLAGITVRTMFAKRAYALAENFRQKGVKTPFWEGYTPPCAPMRLSSIVTA